MEYIQQALDFISELGLAVSGRGVCVVGDCTPPSPSSYINSTFVTQLVIGLILSYMSLTLFIGAWFVPFRTISARYGVPINQVASYKTKLFFGMCLVNIIVTLCFGFGPMGGYLKAVSPYLYLGVNAFPFIMSPSIIFFM